MLIELENFTINNIDVSGSLLLEGGEMTLLEGENGVGKTSIFHELNLNHKKYFKGRVVRIIDQMRLSPLNEISFRELILQMNEYRYEELDCFSDCMERIEKFQDTPINQLSGGQNQMVKIALNIYLSGDVFLFDEPLQFLDKENKIFFRSLVAKLLGSNKSICLVEHNDDSVKKLASKSYQVTLGDFIQVRSSNGVY